MPSVIIETDDEYTVVILEDVTELVDSPVITYLDSISDETDIVESINQTSILDVQVETEIVDSCEQGPKGAKGDSTTIQTDTNIGVGVTEVIDALSVGSNPSGKWLLTVSDVANSLSKVSEVYASQNGATLSSTHYGHAGDVIPYSVSVGINNLLFEVRLTNHHNSSVVVKALRLGTVV